MKLEKLTIKNINSFVGVKEIDFTKLENELFLITGATGSGKTTIFDAICAVLYNKTPRLGGNPKELLNNISDEAYIKLTFSVAHDKFEAFWQVKRKKDKTIGNIKRILYKNETQIADKTTEFEKEISKILNLGFEQFTKAIILAQGEFDAFLKAKDNEKIDVLEKILPIKEYELISKKIYFIKKEIENSIMDINKFIDDIEYQDKSILDENILKEKSLKKDVAKLQTELKNVEEKIKQVTLKNQLLKENQKSGKEIKELENQNFNLEKEIVIIKKEFEKIEKEKKEFEKNLSNNLSELDKAIDLKKVLYNLINSKKEKNFQKDKFQKETNDLINIIEQNSNKIINLNKSLNLLNIKNDEKFKYIQELISLKIEYDNLQKEQGEFNNSVNKNKGKNLELVNKRANLKNLISKNSEILEYLEAKIKVLKYENDREELQNNKPCPLCGSLNHPYKTNAPKVDEKEYKEVQQQLKIDEKELSKIQEEISLIKKFNEEYNKKLEVIKNRIVEIEKTFENKNIKIKKFEELKDKKEEYDKKLEEKNRIENEIKILNTKIEENSKVLDEKKNQLKELENELSNLELELKENKDKAVLLKKELVKRVGEFDDVNLKKDELLQKNQELNKLYNQKQQLLNNKDNNIKTNNKLKEEKEKRVIQNHSKLETITIEDKDYELLKREISEKIRNFSEELGKISQIITNIQKDIQKFKELNLKKEKLNKKLKLYTKLNDLVGSADGKKFKKIAINFMMQELIYIANIHLDKLSNQRYIFEVNEDIDKLDLFVVDKYNENKKRGVATLSGGESFLASLALSFGLSDMIKQKVQIETLFLDEGFGSLDNDTLSNSLNILKDASAGKMIGIISHVDSLKEEIPKQIQVIKKANGRSDLKII